MHPLNSDSTLSGTVNSTSLVGRLEGDSGPRSRLPVRLWGHAKRAFNALDNHWVGDVIALVCMAFVTWGFMVIGWAMS